MCPRKHREPRVIFNLTLILFALFVQGCGTLELNIKTVFLTNGSCKRTINLVAEGIFADELDKLNLDNDIRKEGWEIKTYKEAGKIHKVLSREFAASNRIEGCPQSIMGFSTGSNTFHLQNAQFSRRGFFPYQYYEYRETISPSTELASNKCFVCNGTGLTTCESCGGTGSCPCTTCAGTGYIYTIYGYLRCPGCGGSKRNTCFICSGTGRETCFACCGTGLPGAIQKSMIRRVENMVRMQNEVVLPGKIVASNADRSKGNLQTWDITFTRLETGMTMAATSRRLNWLGIQVIWMSVMIFGCLISYLVISSRNKRSERTPEPSIR